MKSRFYMFSMRSRFIRIKKFILQHDIALAIVLTAATIAVGLFFGWYNNRVVPTHPDIHYGYHLNPHNPLSFMSSWDGPDYLQIVTHGYTAPEANFFPLYPLLVRIVNLVIGSPLDSAFIVAWTAMVGAVYFYLKLLKRLFSVENLEAVRGLLFFLLFPTAVFMLATYTESLFACFSLGAIYFALNKKCLPAALLLLLATATHINGMFVVVLIMLLLWEEGIRPRNAVLTGAVGSLGLAAYAVYCQVKFHSWLEFLTAQKAHGWLQSQGQHAFADISLLNVIFMVLIVAAVAYWWPRRKSFAVYTALFLLIPLVGRQFGGFNRYVFAAFPIPLMLYAYTRNRKVSYSFALALTAIFWTYTLLQYAGGWTGS